MTRAEYDSRRPHFGSLCEYATDSMRREAEFLCLCIAPRPSSETTHIRQLASEDLNWQALSRLSLRHRVMPLFCSALESINFEGAPRTVRDELKRLFIVNSARDSLLVGSLCRITRLFQAHEIRAIAFKGVVLAQRLYQDTSLRQCDDLDFLIHPDDAELAGEVLRSNGFHPLFDLSTREMRAHRQYGWGYCLRSEAKDYYVDLDPRISPRHFGFDLPFEELWEHRSSLLVKGQEIPVLSLEHLPLVLSVHGAKHLWKRLSWLCDVGRLLDQGLPCSHETMTRATDLGGRRMLLVAFALASGLTGQTLPKEMEYMLNDDRAALDICRNVSTWIWRDADVSFDWKQTFRFHIQIRERIRDKVRRTLLPAITPSYGDWKAMRLPARLFFLYYLLRPFRLVWKIVKGVKGKREQPRSNCSITF